MAHARAESTAQEVVAPMISSVTVSIALIVDTLMTHPGAVSMGLVVVASNSQAGAVSLAMVEHASSAELGFLDGF